MGEVGKENTEEGEGWIIFFFFFLFFSFSVHQKGLLREKDTEREEAEDIEEKMREKKG